MNAPRDDNRNGASKRPTFSVTRSGKRHDLSVEEAFVLAHQLVSRAHCEAAVSILEWLEVALANDRRVGILHAHCEAKLGRFASCNQLLNQVFLHDEELRDVSPALHGAIVFRSIGLLSDARSEMKALCEKYPKLPSLWLFAGDLELAVQRADDARRAWKNAYQLDVCQPKVIATTVQHQLRELDASQPRSTPRDAR